MNREPRYRITGPPTPAGTLPADDLDLGRAVEMARFPIVPGATEATAGVLSRIAAVRHPVVATMLEAELGQDHVTVVWPAPSGRPVGASTDPLDAVLAALAQAADALDRAHRVGLAHGALQPRVLERRPGRASVAIRLHYLGLVSLTAVAAGQPEPAGARADRAAFARVVRELLDPAAAGAAERTARLGPPVEHTGPPRVPPAAKALLESAALGPSAAPSCTDLVANLGQLLRT